MHAVRRPHLQRSIAGDRSGAGVRGEPAPVLGAAFSAILATRISDVSRLVRERGGYDLMPELGYAPTNKYRVPPASVRDRGAGRRRVSCPTRRRAAAFSAGSDRLLSGLKRAAGFIAHRLHHLDRCGIRAAVLARARRRAGAACMAVACLPPWRSALPARGHRRAGELASFHSPAISQNGGWEAAIVVNKVRDGQGAFGFNAASGSTRTS